jgi:ribosomal protein L11
MKEKEKEKNFRICLRIGGIEGGPPLSTILGNYGINTTKFVSELKIFNEGLPAFFINVFNVNLNLEDKSFKFVVEELTTARILRIISFEKTFKKKDKGGYIDFKIKVVSIDDFYSVCYLKYGNCEESNLKSLFGVLRSCDLMLV